MAIDHARKDRLEREKLEWERPRQDAADRREQQACREQEARREQERRAEVIARPEVVLGATRPDRPVLSGWEPTGLPRGFE